MCFIKKTFQPKAKDLLRDKLIDKSRKKYFGYTFKLVKQSSRY